jgi:hypothetical protein
VWNALLQFVRATPAVNKKLLKEGRMLAIAVTVIDLFLN